MSRARTPFSVGKASDSSGFLLWQVMTLWRRRIAAALRALDLTQVQFALLASLPWLSRTGGAHLGEEGPQFFRVLGARRDGFNRALSSLVESSDKEPQSCGRHNTR